jgi:restriction system protein
MEGMPSVFLHFLWLIPLILLIAYLGSPRFKGTMGEARVGRLLATMLERNRYTVFNNLILPSNGGTVQIDHVVISKFGIFVIETEFRGGWISGAEFQDRWAQHRFKSSTRFQNPMHLNHLNVEALARLLQLPESKFHYVVVFMGHRGFKKSMPFNVMPAEKLISYIRKRTEPKLAEDQARQALTRLEQARLRPRPGLLADPWVLLRLVLIVALLAGAWAAFHAELGQWVNTMKERSEMRSSPGKFHPDGRLKTEQELWQDSLICAWSVDGGRCSCYEPGGSKVDLGLEKCRSLAEKGSILKQ